MLPLKGNGSWFSGGQTWSALWLRNSPGTSFMTFFNLHSLSLLTPGRGLSSLCDFSGKTKRHLRVMGQCFCEVDVLLEVFTLPQQNLSLKIYTLKYTWVGRGAQRQRGLTPTSLWPETGAVSNGWKTIRSHSTLWTKPSLGGFPKVPEFAEHRFDQIICSLANICGPAMTQLFINGVTPIRKSLSLPSQFGPVCELGFDCPYIHGVLWIIGQH